MRARVIWGDQRLADAFNQTRREILTKPRDQSELKKQVVEMRDKMYKHLAAQKAGRFLLKQDSGGITDIEFIAQYLVLNFSSQKPKLTKWSDNVRIFESLVEQGVMTNDQATAITGAYTTMRDQIHRRSLLNLDADVAEDKYQIERQAVKKAWREWLAE